ncbi:hypothetical protein A3D11_04645 [Candidatus Peribacteria bacterium RIFCSPHIGHO2_02_FULL_49_16]|nr:MAG: hypothetical protein A2880_04210 [Candidatus Peribacteria bacterium RIFCSPHIGHO2_01_FULL_49_38]OGJ58985.1 MAG: hypothetical protein A3D11_04645 [Candidatus Peribacteria bacterium RIFCSPHIGHO2_02_FULL_49_16]
MPNDPQDSSQPQKPPIRPGDTVPQEGLDPSQVFSSGAGASQDDRSAPSGSGQATKQGDDTASGQTQLSQDQGPPPPPPKTQATTEMGYDEEDLQILTEVGDYRFGNVVDALTNDNIIVPLHAETTFDEQKFLTFLRGSISLTRDEKWRIIQAIPKLSQFQVDELQKILEEEKRKFSELSPKHLSQLQKLEQKHADDWKDLQTVSQQQSVKQEDQQQAEEIKKNLGL